MKRLIIVNVSVFGFIGDFMVYLGYPFTAWEFWVILLSMVILQINNTIRTW